MIPLTELSEYLYQMATGENRVGSRQRERERERERERDGAYNRFGNGAVWK